MKVIEVKHPELVGFGGVEGMLEKQDGQKISFRMGNGSSSYFCLENKEQGIQYDYEYKRSSGKVTIKAFDRREGKAFDYQVLDAQTYGHHSSLGKLCIKAEDTRQALATAVIAFCEKYMAAVESPPADRDF